MDERRQVFHSENQRHKLVVMTIREAILTLPFEVSDPMVERALVDAGLNGNIAYTADNTRAVDLCMAELCRMKASEPDFSEGELSVSIDRGAILKLRDSILSKYNLSEGGLSGASVW